jgi:protein-tyrosine phosphatase
MLAALERAGYSYGGHRARTFRRADFTDFDLIIPQDHSNKEDILALARNAADAAKVRGMWEWFAEGETERDVPDPYYGGPAGFDAVVALLARAMQRLVAEELQG